MTDWTFGVNWFLNPYSKLVFNYIRSQPDVPGKGRSDTDIFAMSFVEQARVFAAHGFGRTSLRMLIEASQMSTTAFYARFASKDAVLAALVDRVVGAIAMSAVAASTIFVRLAGNAADQAPRAAAATPSYAPVALPPGSVRMDLLARTRDIGEIVTAAGGRYVDGGIIGPPPKAGENRTRFYMSGPDAPAAAVLGNHGLDVRLVEGGIGAASAVKSCAHLLGGR